MPGGWLTRIARRFTRPETFNRLISPAIADLQTEWDGRWRTRARYCAGMFAVIAYALARDFRADVALAFDSDARRRIWIRAAFWALAAGLGNWALAYRMTSDLLGAFDSDPIAGMVLSRTGLRSLVPALAVALAAAAYGLRRRAATGSRDVVAATAVLAVATAVVSLAVNAVETQFSMALELAAYGTQAATPLVFRWPPLPWRVLTMAVSVIPFAWLGVVLARRRGWTLALISTAILGTWMFANLASLYMLELLVRFMPGLRPILQPLVTGTYAIPPNLLTLVALILMWRALETGFDRFASARTR